MSETYHDVEKGEVISDEICVGKIETLAIDDLLNHWLDDWKAFRGLEFYVVFETKGRIFLAMKLGYMLTMPVIRIFDVLTCHEVRKVKTGDYGMVSEVEVVPSLSVLISLNTRGRYDSQFFQINYEDDYTVEDLGLDFEISVHGKSICVVGDTIGLLKNMFHLYFYNMKKRCIVSDDISFQENVDRGGARDLVQISYLKSDHEILPNIVIISLCSKEFVIFNSLSLTVLSRFSVFSEERIVRVSFDISRNGSIWFSSNEVREKQCKHLKYEIYSEKSQSCQREDLQLPKFSKESFVRLFRVRYIFDGGKFDIFLGSEVPDIRLPYVDEKIYSNNNFLCCRKTSSCEKWENRTLFEFRNHTVPRVFTMNKGSDIYVFFEDKNCKEIKVAHLINKRIKRMFYVTDLDIMERMIFMRNREYEVEGVHVMRIRMIYSSEEILVWKSLL